MGHEGVGTVLEAPESPTFKPGDRVLISHGAYCGRCFACRNGLSQAHSTGMVGGGERAGSSTTVPEFFVDGLAPVERADDCAFAARFDPASGYWEALTVTLP